MATHLAPLTVDQFDSSNVPALPNELLHEIALLLGTSDLRRVSQVNHELHSYVTDFLARYRYHAGIFRLPGNLLLQVAHHLSQRDRCRLAQASQNLHPTVMDLVIRHNITNNGSSILNHAAKNNLKHLAREVIRLGGHVDTVCDTSFSPMPRALIWHYVGGYFPFTPLMSAAFHGHEGILNLLLQAGAGQYTHGITAPLGLAMLQRDKQSCEVLLKELPVEDMPAILKTASDDKFVQPVRWLLEAGQDSIPVRQARTVALYHILNEAASTSDFVKRELRPQNHLVIFLLVKYGADSNYCKNENKFNRPLTARQLASRHPDPRVRNVLGASMPVAVPKTEKKSVQIGRAHVTRKEETDSANTIMEDLDERFDIT
jgi:hypothetical protein